MPIVRTAVILAGGYGTRLMEETQARPKPMVEIGGKPILWHIMKIYASFGVERFIIPLGYKGNMIKQYFAEYDLNSADVTIDLANHRVSMLKRTAEPWTVTLVDTGQDTMTGGRIRRLREHIGDEPFYMTYGDGVASIDLAALSQFHASHGRIATITAVRPPSRFGTLDIVNNQVMQFQEKPIAETWINGGFFVLSSGVFDVIDNDATVFEADPLERLAAAGQLMAYNHLGFWHSMDTLRDKRQLETYWADGNAPWKVW